MLISRLLAPLTAATSSFNFSWIACDSMFCERWMRKTIRKVTIVVPVLMMSCHVSLKGGDTNGPVAAQTMMTPNAIRNAHDVPVQRVAQRARVSPHPQDRGVFSLPIVASSLRSPASEPAAERPVTDHDTPQTQGGERDPTAGQRVEKQ